MHDNQLSNLRGWPDVESAPSIVRCVKQSVPIVMPAGIASPTWDCHVTTWPWLDALSFNLSTYRTNNVAGLPEANPFELGGVCAYGVPGGTSLNLATSLQVPGTPVTLDRSFTRGPSRIVGMGIEVNNTTSDLYKQGTTTVYRSSQTIEEPFVATTYLADNHFAYYTAQFFNHPPQTVAHAMLYPGSRQWKAADGSYQVVCFAGQDNPPRNASYTQPLVYFGDQDVDLCDSVNTNNIYATTPALTPTILNHHPSQCTKLYPVHQAGAIFSGLSPQTTLTLNVNIYIETFPSYSDASLMVLATPSCQYDPVALNLLSHVMSTLPVGVPAYQNGLGEWFSEVVDVVADWAPKVGAAMGAIGLPGASLLGGGLGTLANIYRKPKQAYTAPPSAALVAPPSVKQEAAKQKKELKAMEAADASRTGAARPRTRAAKSKPKKKGKSNMTKKQREMDALLRRYYGK